MSTPTRTLRLAVAGAVAASLVAAGGATAAPPCNLLTDAKGDAQLLGEAPNDASLDVVSADIASDAKTLTGVVRVDSFSALSPTSPLGRGYYLLFNAPGSKFPLYLNVQITPDLTRFAWGTRETLPSGSGSYVRKGEAKGVVDAAKNELRVSVPLSALSAVTKVKPGTKLSGLTASTTSVLGTSATGGLVATVDEAATSKTYVTGSKSCVAPGK